MRGRLRRLALFLATCLVLFGVVIGISIHRAGDPDRLDQEQWRRLTERFKKAHRTDVQATGSVATIAEPAAAAAIVEVAARPHLPTLDQSTVDRQAADYGADRPKTVLELQAHRRSSKAALRDAQGRSGSATLINLNPRINSWYLLELSWAGGPSKFFHLVNAHPERQDLELRAWLHDRYRPPAGRLVGSLSAATPGSETAGTRRDRHHRTDGGHRPGAAGDQRAGGRDLHRRIQTSARGLQGLVLVPDTARQPLRLHRERSGAEQAPARAFDPLRRRRRPGRDEDLQHTYLALYRAEAGKLVVEHLEKGMTVLDKTVQNRVLPRFLAFSDNRDFFYLSRIPAGERP